MRYISADFTTDEDFQLIENGILVITDDGIVEQLINPAKDKELYNQIEHSNIKNYHGLICPGFVNTHCHLELSYLKNQIQEKTGFAGFVSEIEQKKIKNSELIQHCIDDAESEMLKNGIVAVGDISNTNYTLHQKIKGRLYYHTFIECYASNQIYANKAFEKACALYNEFEKINSKLHHCSITPHAPYSVSKQLFNQLTKWITTNNSIATIHNQESREEDDFFKNGSGSLAKFIESFGTNVSEFITGTSSLQSVITKLPKQLNTLLVHNTYTELDDITSVKEYFAKAFWCFCPSANLYIENRLPDIDLFVKNECTITLGTDSLASNHQLSILEEMKTIHKRFPHIPIDKLLKWSSLNGAKFLKIDDHFGNFAKGKQPGIVNIKNLDLKRKILTEKASADVIH